MRFSYKKSTSIAVLIFFFLVNLISFNKPNHLYRPAAQKLIAVEGKAECVMDVNSRRILYQSHADLRLPMASTTKIVTAITVLESGCDIQEKIAIPKEAEGIEGSSVYLKAGEIYTVEELLYGLMLRSGNDCATALALHCGKTIPDFSAKMNVTAQKAGALTSNFKNPHGLSCKNHYTTANDLCSISCYAMKNPIFKEIVATRFYPPRNWQNKNKILTRYPGGIGIKTGYTLEAGRCLVSAAERDGMTLVCVLLNCPTTYERTATLFDDAFSAYKYTEILAKNSIFTIQDGNKSVGCKVTESFCYPLLDAEKGCIEFRTQVTENSIKEKKSNEIVGQIEIYLTKRLLFSTNLYKL